MKSPVSTQVLKKAAVIVFCTILAACSSYGPKSMDRDQLDYGNSIGENWKNQMLINIVKMRYVDMPVFVDVGAIVSGYSLSTTVKGNVGINTSFTGGDSSGLGASGTYTDRPTITYMPKTGDDYLRAILEPVKPKNLLGLVQAGYSSELLFTWAVESINGVQNWTAKASNARPAEAEFVEFVSLLQELQSLGAVGFEIKNDPNSGDQVIFTLNKLGLSESTMEKSRRAGEIIGLQADREQYRVIYAPFKTDPDTLTIQTRSVLQMLGAMAGFIDIPPELSTHAAPGHNLSTIQNRPFHVLSGKDRPDESFAAVKYNDYWYWIENTDMASKRVFTLMLFITTLTNTKGAQKAPVLTIPTN
jgi:hypothetical protein